MLGFLGIGKKVEFHDAMVELCNEYKDALEMAMRRLDHLKTELKDARDQILAMDIQFSAVKAENTRLVAERDALRAKLDRFVVMMPLVPNRVPTVINE